MSTGREPARLLSAGELDPDAPWCPGCGFANYSAAPCEVCGYDDQAAVPLVSLAAEPEENETQT